MFQSKTNQFNKSDITLRGTSNPSHNFPIKKFQSFFSKQANVNELKRNLRNGNVNINRTTINLQQVLAKAKFQLTLKRQSKKQTRFFQYRNSPYHKISYINQRSSFSCTSKMKLVTWPYKWFFDYQQKCFMYSNLFFCIGDLVALRSSRD